MILLKPLRCGLASGPSRKGACRHPRGAAWSASQLRRVVASSRRRDPARTLRDKTPRRRRSEVSPSSACRPARTPHRQIKSKLGRRLTRRGASKNASHAPPLPPPTPCATVPSIDVRCRGPRRAASILQRRKCPAAAAAAETASAGLSVPHRLGCRALPRRPTSCRASRPSLGRGPCRPCPCPSLGPCPCRPS